MSVKLQVGFEIVVIFKQHYTNRLNYLKLLLSSHVKDDYVCSNCENILNKLVPLTSFCDSCDFSLSYSC